LPANCTRRETARWTRMRSARLLRARFSGGAASAATSGGRPWRTAQLARAAPRAGAIAAAAPASAQQGNATALHRRRRGGSAARSRVLLAARSGRLGWRR
jgi:hypothetical protein